MKMASSYFLHLLLLGLVQFDQVSGKEIVLAIPQNKGNASSINVYITSSKVTNVSVETKHPGISRSVHVTPETGYQLSLPSSLMQNGSRVEAKGVLVSSPDDINVNVVIRSECCGGEGYNALHAERLGKEYLVCSMYNSLASVVALDNDTIVNITKRFSGTLSFNGINYFYGDVISVALNRLETIQLLAERSYLIGSIIKANKPIGVISGQYYGSLTPRSSGKSDQNQMIEYLPPVREFGRHFIVPQIMNASYVRLVVFTANHGANVSVSAQGFDRKLTVRKYGSSVVTVRADRPNIFKSDNPIILVLYPHGIKPFMTYIPNEAQYSNQVKLIVPRDFVSYVALITRARDVDGFRIDDMQLYSLIDNVKAVADSNGVYLTINSHVVPGQHVISHVDKSVRFGCICYGFNADSSYGFPV